MSNTKKATPMKLILWITAVIVIFAGLLFYWHHEKMYPSTDDAYIQAHVVHVAAQVTGPVAKIYVNNNEVVEKNQPLFDIDPASFQIAVNKAQAALAEAKQNMQASQQAVIAAHADVVAKQSQYDVAVKNAKRILTLVPHGEASKAQGDAVVNDVNVARAGFNSAVSEFHKAQAALGQQGDQNAAVRQAAAELAQAQLDLRHTHIVAPTSGKLVNFDLRVGTMVQQEQDLFDLVNENLWWAEANFKETQLARIRDGQRASITVDMYPGHHFSGTVESMSAGSGSEFSMLPPENATGNWVKVTQRFPIKVVVNKLDSNYPLRAGASATVIIDTKAK
jgi:membrane fusion protein, multidrug efflux system